MRVAAEPRTLGMSSSTAASTTSLGFRVSPRAIFSSKAVTFQTFGLMRYFRPYLRFENPGMSTVWGQLS